MTKKTRIRQTIRKPVSPGRKKELARLHERDVGTVEQYQSFKKLSDEEDEAFTRRTKHWLHCGQCGSTTEETIESSTMDDWLILYKNRTIMRVWCPKCSRTLPGTTDEKATRKLTDV